MGRLPLEEHDGIAQLQRVFEGSKKDGLCGTGVSVQQVRGLATYGNEWYCYTRLWVYEPTMLKYRC